MGCATELPLMVAGLYLCAVFDYPFNVDSQVS